MDILSICPSTKTVIRQLEYIIEECTNKVRQQRQIENNQQKFNLSNAVFSQQVNNIQIYHETTQSNSNTNQQNNVEATSNL